MNNTLNSQRRISRFALTLTLIFTTISFAAEASLFVNGQLHRDFDREIYTSTVEIFGLDGWGSTFFFTDFDFDSAGQTVSYFELSRNLLIKRTKLGGLNLSLQFNDGVAAFDDAAGQKSVPRTWLAGPAIADIKLGPVTCEVQALYRQEFASDPGWQLTTVWFWPIAKTPFEFLGYFDWNSNEYGHNPTSFQAEPQLQYRYKHMAVGSEVEISRNFQGAFTKDDGFEFKKWYVHPTLFLRYDL
jgi:hypothetical protein